MSRSKVVAWAIAGAVVLAVAGWRAYDALVAEPVRREAREAASAARLEAEFGIDRTNVPAPPLEVLGMDGQRFTLAQLHGQVVFVNFWATWCPPCREEFPSMVRLGLDLQRRFPGKFRMVTVSVDEGWDPVRQFFGGQAPPVDVTLDSPDQTATRAYYCAARKGCPDSYKFPESYIVDPSGRLVAYVVGPRDWSDPAASRFIERLLGK
jgi:thiol-disulfide isomerase/thioredoxin